MTLENSIMTVFANQMVATYGPEKLALISDLPAFVAVEQNGHVSVIAADASDCQKRLLTQALEVYADRVHVPVHFEGLTMKVEALAA